MPSTAQRPDEHPSMTSDNQEYKLRWLQWCRRIQAIAQDGIAYTKDHYDRERFEALRDVAAEILAEHSQLTAEQSREILLSEKGVATPKVDVRAAIFDGDRLLLVRARGEGRWSLPGGWATPGETPSQALVREVEEETGIKVRVSKTIAVHDNDLHGLPSVVFQVYKIIMLAELVEGTATESYETDGVGFFGIDELPPLCEYRTGSDEIALAFAHHDNPKLPTSID